MRRFLHVLSTAFLLLAPPAARAAPHVLTWGIDTALTPANVCLYYVSANCFPIGTMTVAGVFTPQLSTPGPIGGTTPSTGAFTTLTVPEGTALVKLGFQATGDYLGTSNYSGNKYAYGANSDVVMTAGGAASTSPLTLASRTLGSTGTQSFGSINWCFNDFVGARDCWVNYSESRRYSGATSGSQVAEWEVTEFGTSTGHDPYSRRFALGNYSAGLRLYSGGGCVTATKCWDAVALTYTAVSVPASVALAFGNNGSSFNTGINFANDSLTGVDGKTAGQSAPAIKFASGHSIDWQSCTNITSYPNNCAVDNVTARITASQGTAAILTKMVFVDAGIQFNNILGNSEFQIITNATDTAGLVVSGGSGSNTVLLSASGTQANVNIIFLPKGTGVVQINAPLFAVNLVESVTAPTVSGFCTSPSVTANNGTWGFSINVGTACAASAGTITLPAATNGWVCTAHDVTTPASNIVEQSSGTATTAVFTNYVRTTGVAGNFTSSDVLRVHCAAF